MVVVIDTALVVVVTRLIRFTRFELLSFGPVMMLRYCDVGEDDDDGNAVVVALRPMLLLTIFNFFGLLACIFTLGAADWALVMMVAVGVLVDVGVDARMILRVLSVEASSLAGNSLD